jgi:hypothetical protein
MNTTAPATHRVITLGKASTRHISPVSYNHKGNAIPVGYPLCGQAQGRHGQGSRPVNHASWDLSRVTCTKCANIPMG